MTPEQALNAYRPMVEEQPQATPLLILEVGNELHIVPLSIGDEDSGASAAWRAWQALRHMFPQVDGVLLASEAWLRSDAGTPNEALHEGVMLAYASGTELWITQQVFVRTRDGIRWDEVVHLPVDQVGGDVKQTLQDIVGVS